MLHFASEFTYDYAQLDEAVADLCTRFGFTDGLEMPRRRQYVAGRPHYSSYYTDYTRDLVRRWYQPEIDALGYEFEEG